MLQHLRQHAGGLDHRAVGRQVAAQDRQPAAFAVRVLQRPDARLVQALRALHVLQQRLARHRLRAGVQDARPLGQLPQDRGDAAGPVHVLDVVARRRRHLADVRHALGDLVDPLQRYSTPASWAMARVCSTVLVEPPIAMSSTNALSIASAVTMSRGLRSRSIRLSSCRGAAPALRADHPARPGSTARIVPLPGRAMPSASHRQFIELAVNMPEHEPHVGQPDCSSSLSSGVVDLARPGTRRPPRRR